MSMKRRENKKSPARSTSAAPADTSHSPFTAEELIGFGLANRFTQAEIKVFALRIKGQTRLTIAQTLHMSLDTVGTHLGHIHKKLGVHKCVDLLMKLVEFVLPALRQQK